MFFYLISSIDEATVPLRQVMITQMLDQALDVLIVLAWESELLFHCHLKDFVWIVVHEGTSAYCHLVQHNSKSIKVCWLTITFVTDDLRSHVLWSTADSVCYFTSIDLLCKAKVCELYVPSVVH